MSTDGCGSVIADDSESRSVRDLELLRRIDGVRVERAGPGAGRRGRVVVGVGVLLLRARLPRVVRLALGDVARVDADGARPRVVRDLSLLFAPLAVRHDGDA